MGASHFEALYTLLGIHRMRYYRETIHRERSGDWNIFCLKRRILQVFCRVCSRAIQLFYSVSISSRRHLTLFLRGPKYKYRESGIYPMQVTRFLPSNFMQLKCKRCMKNVFLVSVKHKHFKQRSREQQWSLCFVITDNCSPTAPRSLQLLPICDQINKVQLQINYGYFIMCIQKETAMKHCLAKHYTSSYKYSCAAFYSKHLIISLQKKNGGKGERKKLLFPQFQNIQCNRKDKLVHKCSIN